MNENRRLRQELEEARKEINELKRFKVLRQSI